MTSLIETPNEIELTYVAIYKLHGLSALPDSAVNLDFVALSNPSLKAVLTIDPEPYLKDIDKAAAIGTQLLKGVFAPENSGTFEERLAAEIAEVKRVRGTSRGVFAVLKGELQVPTPEFKARRDTDEFGVSLDDVSKDEIRGKFQQSVQAVLTGLSLSLPEGTDRGFEKAGEVMFLTETGNTKPIFILNFRMGGMRGSVARPLTTEIAAEAKDLATRLKSEASSRAYSLLRTSLDRKTDGLQGFIAAWSALEIFINGTFKSTYEARWFQIMEEGAPASSKPVFVRFADVMKDKYRLADKFLIIVSMLDAIGAEADEKEFRRLKKVRDELLHALDVPPGPLPTEAVQRLLLKFMKLHLGVSLVEG
ncbi:hypothetical protein [Mesorhizobium sp. M0060]|uniref:hypothetical protein n=1 Tax=Mesorhizobium sp. M0060 TaxID=2956866 RepID=UPI00333608D6